MKLQPNPRGRTMKRYKLLKDFLALNYRHAVELIHAGTIVEDNHGYTLKVQGEEVLLDRGVVEHNPKWFEEVEEIRYYKRIKDSPLPPHPILSPYKVGDVISTDVLRLNLEDWQETTKEEYDSYIHAKKVQERIKKDVQILRDRTLQQLDDALKHKGRIADAPQGTPTPFAENLGFYKLSDQEQQVIKAMRQAREAGIIHIREITLTSGGIIILEDKPPRIQKIHMEKF